MIETVLFDLDGTLLDRATSVVKFALSQQQAGLKDIWKVSPRWNGCDGADAICENLSALPDIVTSL